MGSHRELTNGFFFQVHEGMRIFLGPILPEDRWRLAQGFAGLSPESRYYRFFSCRRRLTEKELLDITEVDQVSHVAWGAFDTVNAGMPALGLGRFFRDEEDTTAAELTMTVVDAHQHQGLGTILLAVLVLRAEAVGVDRLRAYILPENLIAIRWLHGLGAETLSKQEYFELELRIGPESGAKARTPSRVKFDRLLEAIRGIAPAALLDEGRD